MAKRESPLPPYSPAKRAADRRVLEELEQRERDVRTLRRTTVLLLRAAERCTDPEEAAATRATERELRALADRWEAER